jgi:hypothetical protein
MLHVAANSFLGYLKLQARPNSPVLCGAQWVHFVNFSLEQLVRVKISVGKKLMSQNMGKVQ